MKFNISDDLRKNRLRKNKEEFKGFNRSELSSMDDRELAEWQAEFNQDEAQWRIAEHEWQRRITAESIGATMKAARGQAWFGIAGIIIGAIITFILTIYSR